MALVLIVAMTSSALALAAKTNERLWSRVIHAKSVYLENQTGNDAVLETATEQFSKWGRFEIAQSESNADLIVEFKHKKGMDKWGNLGFIEMEVFSKGENKPAFEVKKAFRLVFEPQLRTKNCIAEFEKQVERKQGP